MPATSFNPLLDRIQEVMVDGQGDARTLTEAYRWRRANAPDRDYDEHAKSAMIRRSYFVTIEDAVRGDQASETFSDGLHQITLQFELYWAFESDLELDKLQDVVTEAASDMHRLRGALGWKGNLDQTEAGDDTGLASGMLLYRDFRLQRLDSEKRILHYRMRFEGFVVLSY